MSTPLHEAAKSGNVDEARELLKHGRYDVNCTDKNGITSLVIGVMWEWLGC